MRPLRALTRWQQNLLLFLLVAAGHLAWRAPGDLVWDDSPTVCENVCTPTGTPLHSFADPALWPHLWTEVFGSLQPDGYRPLSGALRRLGAAYVGDRTTAPAGLLLLNAALAGLLAVVYYRLARQFTRTAAAALFAVFLLLASTPMLTGLLVLFTGLQALVPLVVCGALHCYRAAVTGPRPGPWLALLAVLLFLGPWYREFVGLTPLLLLLLEAQRSRPRGGIALLAALAFLHALFPTALPHALFFPDLPVAPVYRLGVLGERIHAGVDPVDAVRGHVPELLESLRWRIFLDLPSVLPPLLFVLAAAGWVVSAVCRRAAPLPRRQAVFLGAFFLLTFLPFLKVFKEHVHLAYCLVPACILLAASVEPLWEATRGRPVPRLLVLLPLLLGAGDHALNPWVVRGATRHCYAAVRRVARFCDREVPPGSVVLSNAHHAADVRFHCRGRFACAFTALTSGQRDLWVKDYDGLEDFLRRVGDTPLYCLDVRLPDSRNQPAAERPHWPVALQALDLRSAGRIGQVSYRYPVLDPLKQLLPVQVWAWPGSPDLEFDYYRGPAAARHFWTRKVAVDYYFYEVTGRQVNRVPPPGDPYPPDDRPPRGPHRPGR